MKSGLTASLITLNYSVMDNQFENHVALRTNSREGYVFDGISLFFESYQNEYLLVVILECLTAEKFG